MKKIGLMIAAVALLVIGGFLFLKNRENTDVNVASVDESVQEMMTVGPSDFVLNLERLDEDTKNRRSLLKNFIQQKLMPDGQIITNYLPDGAQKNEATGHDLLSESAGIYLLDLAALDTQGRFDVFYKKMKEMFYDGTQFSYRVSEKGKRYPVNASLDDLRIMRALIIAEAKFGNDAFNYEKEVKAISTHFLKQSTNNGLLIDFYDEENKEKSQDISLFYLDYKTLAYLYQMHGISEDYLQYQVNIAKNGYISDDFPLYHQKYSYKEEEYQDGNGVNIIESLLTIRYLAEIGEVQPTSIAFVKDRVAKGTLFNSYDLNGNAIDKNQSAASYAIAALIGYFVDDQELYTQAIEILKNFQTMDPTSILYGGFGDTITKEVYSFNNLMALLAYGI
ncbi:hypothetical protein ACYSNR_06415 [Enterococcus sp. LJL128]